MRSWFILALVPAVIAAEGLASTGETCNSQDDCLEGLQCFSGVCLNKACIIREAREITSNFNGNDFRDQLLQEAGLTTRDLLAARWRHLFDNEAFIQSNEAQTFLDVIKKHNSELEQMANVMTTCADEDPAVTAALAAEQEKSIGDGFGNRVGNLMGTVKQFAGRERDDEDPENRRRLQERGDRDLQVITIAPSASPSVSLAPSIAPSPGPTPGPTFPLRWKQYFGFHIEAGIIAEASFSVLYPNTDEYDRPDDESNAYGRGCAGFRLGAGADVSLIGLTTYNRDANDVRGNSNLFDFDIYSGVGVGFGVGVYTSGDTTEEGGSRTHFEFTIGTGGSAGFGGAASCTTRWYNGFPRRDDTEDEEDP